MCKRSTLTSSFLDFLLHRSIGKKEENGQKIVWNHKFFHEAYILIYLSEF